MKWLYICKVLRTVLKHKNAHNIIILVVVVVGLNFVIITPC